ncbi:hypothetical protein CANCADRAFT_2288 [Tortispora caseinolytica NRRL Y-17796]|uniref:peptidylprolyl isomerase n=1 Tax=Tortispora caseinolytica NRRL Y-17796 TaxID=767744 RepID=A0A1E4TFV7_9ASCO|nr:hypothetical protein CANCADRAFT_2288 [Tortispora caseinolytica NRRL Y-17796]
MSVLLETTIGDLVVDLDVDQCLALCLEFVHRCANRQYDLVAFKSANGVIRSTGAGGKIFTPSSTLTPYKGSIGFIIDKDGHSDGRIALIEADTADHADIVSFGEVAEGQELINGQPFTVLSTTTIMDPISSRKLNSSRTISDDTSDIDAESSTHSKIESKALTLELLGDIKNSEEQPDQNVLFVCKLNPVTTAEDLKTIFSRFGPIRSCDIKKDKETGASLQYAFIDFVNKEDCEQAYFKMENALIDDRRIHVDFSQSTKKSHRKKRRTVQR